MKWGIILWCLFFLSGCGSKKQSYRSETVSTAISSQKDSSHVTESVQRTITELLEYKGTGIITITELSKPDSIGNQYIVKTTQMDIHSEQKRSVTTEENSDKQETNTSIQVKDEGIKEIVTDDVLIDRRFVLPSWVSGLIVILSGCVGLWIAKKLK
ncbi:hypothetical protein H8S77_14425 [Parabacteroides sp. BX2]|jgi:hypothetical protein|uniref:Lipoprotein n=1 Tax=Parabacteroides segnis TaxID=2763058 RepID=A0ABR7E3Z7_9BACT|nr:MULTISPECIES: hypothetical protein [Parabacteroides]MBC5644076.1 hypothetical protein [Parabacteroides segnis]MCM0714220.1 hypothetical protein [Parabacteroides sp. TA-V-105]